MRTARVDPSEKGRVALVGGVGEQRDVARALKRDGEPPLVAGTGSGDATRKNLAPLADEAAKARDLLVVDQMDLLHAEVANLLMRFSVALIGRWWHGVLSIAPLERDIFRVDVARWLLVMARRRDRRRLDRFGRRRLRL